MANSIWKTPDNERDTGRQVLEHWKNVDNEDRYAAWLIAHSFDKQTIRWCYIEDLIAQADKAELLQKAVDLAVGILKDITFCKQFDMVTDVRKYADSKLEEITNLIKGKNNE